MKKEIWKDIPGYEGIYKASDLGRIKRLSRPSICKTCKPRMINERYLKGSIGNKGYLVTCLTKNRKQKYFRIHQLIAMTFLGFVPNRHVLVIDHIDRDKLNNKLENLRVVTQRENTHNKNIKKTSKYTGVSYYQNHYYARIWDTKLNKNEYLGRYKDEKEASEAYNKRLKQVLNGEM